MKFTGKEYYEAGLERIRQARVLHATGQDYALAMYAAGLAVECLLRAFRWDKDKSFEGRHDLIDLLKASALLNLHEEQLRDRGIAIEEIERIGLELGIAMNEVVLLWHNNLRFASEACLRAFLKRLGRIQGLKGNVNVLKQNSMDLLQAAQTVVDRGVVLWTLKKK
ncbi:MAG: hypothetical protein JWN86_1999 [Planctomycetota bacterium]|nr:hypothetical protein [Planctomycetota bacterium]